MLSPRMQAFVERGLPLVLLAIGISIFGYRYHEYWRDEVNALLEARAVAWSDLVEAMRIEGVPPLYHIILKIFGAILPNPLALVTVGCLDFIILLWGTYRLLHTISGEQRSSLVLTLVFGTTYTYAYELGVMIRQYTLGLGLAFIAWAYLRRALQSGHRRDVYFGTVSAALSALSSAHSACVAGGVLLSFGCMSLWSRRPWRFWRTILLTLPCFAFVAYLASPYENRTADANNASYFPPIISVPLSFQVIVAGIMPSDWWHMEWLLPPRFIMPIAALRSIAFWGILVATAMVVSIRFVSRYIPRRLHRFDALAILSSFGPLLFIIVFHYWGSYRHHIFLGLPAIVVVAGHALDQRVQGAILRPLRQAAFLMLIPWFALQFVILIWNFNCDIRYSFSGTKSLARVLSPNAHLVADEDWLGVGFLFWRPDLIVRSSSGKGRYIRHLRADRQWHDNAPLVPLIVEECAVAPNQVYFVGSQSKLGVVGECGNSVATTSNHFKYLQLTMEFSTLSSIDCACVAQKVKPRFRSPVFR
jgi:hypothetical protein